MSGGKKSNEAALARQEEQARQQRIRDGTERINSIFDGGAVGEGAISADAVFDPDATYYNADGSVWSPSSSPNSIADMFGGESVSDPSSQFAELVRSGKLFSGVGNRDGFNDDFFHDRRNSFIDYASPQLEQQYRDAGEELTFALARGGLLDSSARGEKAAELQRLYDLNKQKVADDALSFENRSRTAIEDARANLITTLNATGDAEGAANAALARSSALSQPDTYSPLGQLFADFTAGLGVQAAQERAFAASGGSYAPRYDTGLFSGAGRVKVRK